MKPLAKFRRFFALLTLSSAGLALAVLFQNCGMPIGVGEGFSTIDQASKADVDVSALSSDDEKFFQLPYSSKPEFMGDLQLLQIERLDTATRRVLIQGALVNVDVPAKAVAYEIRWLGEKRQEVCPARIASTSSNSRVIQYECVMNEWGRLLSGQIWATSALEKKKILVREIRFFGL